MALRHWIAVSDYGIFRWANNFAAAHDGFEDPLKLYVQASEVLFLLALVVLILFGAQRLRRAAVAAGLSAGLALAAAYFLSAAVNRNRPFVDHPTAHLLLKHAKDPGFPSDHATASFAIAFALVLRHRVAGRIAIVAAIVLSFGRVALGVHYPTDVFAGAVLGAVAAVVLWAPPLRNRIDLLTDRFSSGKKWAVLGSNQ